MASEPRVVTADVRRVLQRAIRPDEADYGEAVQTVSERAETSTRTVYRILSGNYAETMNLDLADRLCLAADGHLALDCTVVEATVELMAV